MIARFGGCVLVLVACARPSKPVPVETPAVPTPAVEPAPPIEPPPVVAAPPPKIDLPERRVYERPKEWPPELVFPVSYDPGRAVVTIGDDGDLRVQQSVEIGSVDDVTTAWVEALRDAGFTPREPCKDAPQQHACVWTGHDRLVTTAIGGSWDGRGVDATVQWLPVGHVAKVRLPGACVTPPVSQRAITVHSAGIDQEGEYRQAETRWELITSRGPDLDGDGELETLVPHDSKGTCPWDIPHDVYVMRGTCGHLVGTIVGQLDDTTWTSAFSKGLRKIHTSASWATHGAKSPVPEHHTRERSYAFDGKKLRQKSDETRTGRCHHCGVARCTEG